MICIHCKTKFKDNGKDYCSGECYKKATTNKKDYPSSKEHLNWKEYWKIKQSLKFTQKMPQPVYEIYEYIFNNEKFVNNKAK